MKMFKGQKASVGIAIGTVYYLKRRKADIGPHSIYDVQKETDRVEQAIQEAVRQLGAVQGIALEKMGDKEADLFDIHSMMLTDLDYRDSITDIINKEKVNAEYAVWKTAETFAKMFLDMDNEHMKSQAADVWDISSRLLNILQGYSGFVFRTEKPVIVVADDLYPSEAVQLDRALVLAFVTSSGSADSHTSIFARNMGIPAVASLGATIHESCHGKEAIVDGYGAVMYLEPDRDTAREWAKRHNEEKQKKTAFAALIGLPSKTLDGLSIKLFANIGSPSDTDVVLENDAEGIGLFRSEFLFMGLKDFPSEEHQYVAYRKVAEKMKGRRVTIRTLDIGLDKRLNYFSLPQEENPAMGLRAIRICLIRPEILVTQLRAIYRASAHGNVSIMFPMVTSLWELREAKEIAAKVRSNLKAEGVPHSENVPIGIMIETPAAALISDELAKESDFFSIGTNDLTQYTLAVDRQNSALSRFTDTHHPAILKLVELTARNAKQTGIPVGICGNLAADMELTKDFIKMGIDEFSVPPPMVLPLRKLIREMRIGG
ncbi:MAG: phosphoenolpyruvate--protein phosphotransferase [Treponema sp.]|nr:phosphoenolpyruvate--protein phosphotransferase [Treponema sp.]